MSELKSEMNREPTSATEPITEPATIEPATTEPATIEPITVTVPVIKKPIRKKNSNVDYGFIITRHVNSEKTNRYWNNNVTQLRKFYPFKLIVIIDDNSDPQYLKRTHNVKNIITIQSQFPKRGELLPYIYYKKYKWFENAVIIHDSTFFQKRIPFEKLHRPVIPLWDFRSDGTKRENVKNNLKIANVLTNSYMVKEQLKKPNSYWIGCFGVQSYINHTFLTHLMNKYTINRMLSVVKCRTDRCSLERVMAVLFYLETRVNVSLFGSCIPLFGFSFDDYIHAKRNRTISKPVVKVFTGR